MALPAEHRGEEMGGGNFFRFGLTGEDVDNPKARGYRPRDRYERNAALREVVDGIASGALVHGGVSLLLDRG